MSTTRPPTVCYYCNRSHDPDHIWSSTLLRDGTWLDTCEECLTNSYQTMRSLRRQQDRIHEEEERKRIVRAKCGVIYQNIGLKP